MNPYDHTYILKDLKIKHIHGMKERKIPIDWATVILFIALIVVVLFYAMEIIK